MLTQSEVARMLKLSRSRVSKIEKQALLKLRQSPVLRQLWREIFAEKSFTDSKVIQ